MSSLIALLTKLLYLIWSVNPLSIIRLFKIFFLMSLQCDFAKFNRLSVFSHAEKSFKYPDSDHRKPAVPRVDEKPVMGLHTNKDYITQNAVENIMAVPRKPERKLVDTRNGDKMLLEPSGLEPIFLRKKVSLFVSFNQPSRLS